MKRPILKLACWLWVASWGSVGLLWFASVALPPSRLECLYYALFGVGIVFGEPTLPATPAQWLVLVLSDAAVAAAACLAAYGLALGASGNKAWRRSAGLGALWAAAFIWAFYLGLEYSDPGDVAEHLALGGTVPFGAVGLGLALLRRLDKRARGAHGTGEML
jgi:hypothetical protein